MNKRKNFQGEKSHSTELEHRDEDAGPLDRDRVFANSFVYESTVRGLLRKERVSVPHSTGARR